MTVLAGQLPAPFGFSATGENFNYEVKIFVAGIKYRKFFPDYRPSDRSVSTSASGPVARLGRDNLYSSIEIALARSQQTDSNMPSDSCSQQGESTNPEILTTWLPTLQTVDLGKCWNIVHHQKN